MEVSTYFLTFSKLLAMVFLAIAESQRKGFLGGFGRRMLSDY
jgi:hypothetical protein